jgi:NADPH:quinone reductase
VKAWRVHKNGEPREVMRLEEIPDPEPGAGEVLVRVRAAAVNFPDALLCRGEYQIKPPFPFTPGVELCGEVVSVGEGAEGAEDAGGAALEPGSRVIAQPALPMGGFAERTLVSAASVRKAPDALDDAEAAALHIGYQTGWFGLHRRARIQPGETLLVHAAAGGVGSAAVQLGKAAGARVIGVVGGKAKAETARELGCDVVVDRREDDIVATVKEATGGRGADVIYDPVGGDAYAKSVKCVAFEGRIVVVGFASGAVPTPGLNHALIKNYSILGLHWGLYNTKDPAAVAACHEELTALAADGAVKPLISERVALDEGANAVQRVFDGITTGRVVVVP